MYVNYRAWGNIGHIIDHKVVNLFIFLVSFLMFSFEQALPHDNKSKQDPKKVVQVTCIPFATILLALNRYILLVIILFESQEENQNHFLEQLWII